MPIKSKSKTAKKGPVGFPPKIILMNARNWIHIEPRKHSLSAYEVLKKVIHLLRRSQQVHLFERMERFTSGDLRNIRSNSHSLFIGLTIDGKHAWQQEEEQKGDISIALMIQE